MSGKRNLNALLKDMKPEMQDGKYIFITSKEAFAVAIQNASVMIFREQEGMTAIIRQEIAGVLVPNITPHWAMITLAVHSDLIAVGFLAAITAKLAQAGIPVNPVSAFHHDHLFVPWGKRNEAMEILQSFSKLDQA